MESDGSPSTAEIERRLPTLELIDDERVRDLTIRLTATAPAYFWERPASTSGASHPVCQQPHGLWAQTLMLSTVIDRLADSYVDRNLLEDRDIDLAHASAILHDQRTYGEPERASETSASDHDVLMAELVYDSPLDDRVAAAVASHSGPWDDGPTPESDLERLVHTADMIASSPSITAGVHQPIPEELTDLGLEAVDLR